MSTSRHRANSEESVGDASSKCKEAGGAQDSIFLNTNDDEEGDKEDDEADEIEVDADKEEDAELTLPRQEMDALEHRMHSTATVASVFARTITQSRLARKTLGEEALAAMEDISHGNENPDPGAVTAALEPDAASARAYFDVMNAEVGFTLLHHLQQMDQEIWLGDPIANRIVAFEGDIRQ